MNPFIRSYQPSSLAEVLGQEKAVKELRAIGKQPLLLYGPSGCGKTCSVYALGNEKGWEVIEINASDVRSKAAIEERIGPALHQQSLFATQKIVIIDEVDSLSGNKDRGGVSAIVQVMKGSPFPVILTANNPWDPKYSSLRSKCRLVEFNELSHEAILVILRRICEKEAIVYDESSLSSIAHRSGGDCRAAINDLQSLAAGKRLMKEDLDALSYRNKIESMPKALVKVFKTTDADIALHAFDDIEEDPDKAMLWIEENLPKEYTKPKDLAAAFRFLSQADIFRRRIRRWQHWRFLIYVNALMTAGVAVAKKNKYKSFVQYKQTTRILKIWKANMQYMKRKAIAGKVARKTHCSTRVAIQSTIPYLEIIFKKDKKEGEKISKDLGLQEEEVKWLEK